uniref:Uncharacterized protein n=1 Tax=uncultured Thiotrichaceae bacterium TaxID=298394 RepID=A0A6S6SLS3_9GAMM|nr:MAG: Unknown protein [uncultured Thiotrichaceae bacterium]
MSANKTPERWKAQKKSAIPTFQEIKRGGETPEILTQLHCYVFACVSFMWNNFYAVGAPHAIICLIRYS